MFNILYNVIIRLINCERFNINDDDYLKIVDGMKGKFQSLQPLYLVFLQGKAQSSKSTMVRLPNVIPHHQSSRKGNQYKVGILDTLAR